MEDGRNLRAGKLFTINVQAALRRKGYEDRRVADKGRGSHSVAGERHGDWSQAGSNRGRGGGLVLKCSEG